MSSSGNKVSWSRLKDHTKRQTQSPVDEDFDSLENNFKHKEQHKSSKEKADKHLSNLHILLRNMPNLQGNDLMTSQNFAKFNEKANTSSFNNYGRYKASKSG